MSRSERRISALKAAWTDPKNTVAQPRRKRASGVILGTRHGTRSASLNQPFTEAALASQPAFQASHPPVIVVVIISKKVQKTMQGEHPEFGLQGVPGLAGLPARNTSCNHDIAQKSASFSCGPAAPKRRRREGGKGQDVGWRVLSAVSPVQRADARVWDERDGDLSPRAGRRRRGQPRAKARGASTPPGGGACGDDDIHDEAARS